MAREERTGASSFDELAVGLSSGSLSRGKALKLMGAALVGGVLASIPGLAEAAPKPKPAGRKCKSDSQCASGRCVDRCAGFLGACRSCPENCACVISNEGLQTCVNAIGFDPATSCEQCAAAGKVCIPLSPGGFACGTPCTAG